MVDYLGGFQFLDCIKNVAMNIHVQVVVWTYAFISLEYICSSKKVGYMVDTDLTL